MSNPKHSSALQSLMADGAEDGWVKDDVPEATYVNGDLAHYTMDTMAQFLAEVRRHPPLTAAEEIELAQRIERGDLEAKEQGLVPQPAVGGFLRQALPGEQASDAAGPGAGRNTRADSRGREVRLAPRFQVLDVRDVVDSTGDSACLG